MQVKEEQMVHVQLPFAYSLLFALLRVSSATMMVVMIVSALAWRRRLVR